MKNLLILIMLSLLLSSCIVSLHPLYDEQTKIRDWRLEGEWLEVDSEDPGRFTFSPTSEAGHYTLLHLEEGLTYEYEAVLLKLGDSYYLDVLSNSPAPRESNHPDAAPLLAEMIPCHNFYKLVWEGSTFQLYPFDGDRLEKMVKNRKIRIKHEVVDGRIVITAATADLQKFFLKYASEADAFEEPLQFNKES